MSFDKTKKVVAIAFDGLDPKIVRRLLAAGELPAFAQLDRQTPLSEIATTCPAETPVAFATFSTGLNPGGHGVFDFLRRNPATYLPDHSLNRYEQASRFLPPKVVNLRRGSTLWQHLSAAGLPSAIIRVPCSYPPDDIRGSMLSGLGVPDLRGGLGTPTFYTTANDAIAGHDERVVRLEFHGDTAATHLIGPRHPKTRQDCLFDFKLRRAIDGQTIEIQSSGQPAKLAVAVGQWSSWLRVKFKLGLLMSVAGMVRFYLVRSEPHLELYASAVNFDPDAPPYPISHPPEYARQLSAAMGPFYTTGMVEEHTGLNNGRIDEHAFLQQCDAVWKEREQMLHYELDRLQQGLVFCLFDTSDRIQHMFWRHTEPDHPANRAAPCTAAFADAVDDAYRRCDAILRRVLDRVGDDTLVIAFSDHGFGSFRRGVHLNAWLRDQGLLALKPDADPTGAGGDMLRAIDWDRTQAYSMGLSGIFLNLKGREGQGIVLPDDAHRVEEQIIRGLCQLRDQATGELGVRSVVRRQDVYLGPCAAESPDLMVNCSAGYRIAWSSARGSAAGPQFEENDRRWSGDHIIDPALVPGMLLMNRTYAPNSNGRMPDLRDLAPTILAALGAPPAPAMEGSSLL